jgi:hypothetical protein
VRHRIPRRVEDAYDIGSRLGPFGSVRREHQMEPRSARRAAVDRGGYLSDPPWLRRIEARLDAIEKALRSA